MEAVYRANSGAVLDFNKSLALEPLGGLAHNAPAHLQLLGQVPFGGAPDVPRGSVAAEQFIELGAYFIDKGRRAGAGCE